MDAMIILGAVIGRDGHPGRVARFRLQHALPLLVADYPKSWRPGSFLRKKAGIRRIQPTTPPCLWRR